MLRFFVMVVAIALVGGSILQLALPELARDFWLLIAGFFVVAVVLKFLLDIFVYYLEKDDEDRERRRVLDEAPGRVVYDLKEYANARRIHQGDSKKERE